MDEGAQGLRSLLEQARGGCPRAARELFDQYGPAVQRVVRRRLQPQLRRQYDSDDFVQSAWASFFTSPREWAFATPEELVAFLSGVAYNKVVEKARQRLGTLRYDLNREVPLPSPDDQLPAPTPTPSQHAQADERWQGLVEGLPPGHRRMLELLRDGHTHEEIAAHLRVDPKTIYRLVKRLEKRLE